MPPPTFDGRPTNLNNVRGVVCPLMMHRQAVAATTEARQNIDTTKCQFRQKIMKYVMVEEVRRQCDAKIAPLVMINVICACKFCPESPLILFSQTTFDAAFVL